MCCESSLFPSLINSFPEPFLLRAGRVSYYSVSLKSRNFAGVFRVTKFSLYLQNEGVSRHARNVAAIFNFPIPLQHMKEFTALQNKRVGVLRMTLLARSGTLLPRPCLAKTIK